jgi:hypothetical protein
LIKRRVSVNLVGGGIKKAIGIPRVGSVYIPALHYPDADTFLAAGIHIARIFDRHGRVGCVKAAYVLVVQTLFAPDKDLPEGPFS